MIDERNIKEAIIFRDEEQGQEKTKNNPNQMLFDRFEHFYIYEEMFAISYHIHIFGALREEFIKNHQSFSNHSKY